MSNDQQNDWQVDPYLHVEADNFYNPLTDQRLRKGEPAYQTLRNLYKRKVRLNQIPHVDKDFLVQQGWLVPTHVDLDGRFRLKYVSLEAHSVCNQACYFCPVSVAPRQHHFMPLELYERIALQLADYKNTLEAVFMNNYNEPTIDKHFVKQVEILRSYGLVPAVLTNGSGLTLERIDTIIEMGGLGYLSVNLSTLNQHHYRHDRGKDHLNLVLRHLDYIKDLPVAPLMKIVVLGRGDDQHRADYQEIAARFAGSRFQIASFKANDRAQYLALEMKSTPAHLILRGCEQMGSRPLHHLHITAQGSCVLCCQDYGEQYVVGDLTRQTVAEVLAGSELARYRRWSYGREKAPDNFICRKCIFART
ncbi:MAG: radical SAM protein [Anaerolineae bacterium]|nr:radical SAM protein [Anaerolineae bacterium]